MKPVRNPPQKFSVSFGSKNREAWIREQAGQDPSVALILAAVHFEWVIKRAILVLGRSPTVKLRNELSDVFRLDSKNRPEKTYAGVWKREVASTRKRAGLGHVITRLHEIQSTALAARGRVVHGNGLLSIAQTRESVEIFLVAASQLREFVEHEGKNIDTTLRARRKSRCPKRASER